MKKIDFSIIGKYMEIFDTDIMDIGRKITIQNPDGTTGETNPENPLYKDVPCHISFRTADNPDGDTVDIEPIITGVQINCSLDIDIQKDDYIVAKKLDFEGNVLEIYKGTIGFPTVTQSRKSALMEMRTDI